MACLLCVHNLFKRFDGHEPHVLQDVTLSVNPNEIFVLVGPSGCGKTTLLRIIAGFERADSGNVQLDGQRIEDEKIHIKPERRHFGFVFQDYALFPHMSVIENVCFGLNKLSPQRRKKQAMKLLAMVGMAQYASRNPHELSGGQQQRIALARSLAPNPKLILLDEPFSNIDAGLRQSMRADVRRVLRRNTTSALLVTHDQEEALSFADRIGVMDQGRIVQVGTPKQVYEYPDTAFVAKFLGQTNLIPAQASGKNANCLLGQVDLHDHAQGNVILSIRPEHLTFAHLYPGKPAGQIIRKEFKGHDLTYTVNLDGKLLTIQTTYACPFEVGQSVRVLPSEPAVVVQNKSDKTISLPQANLT